jgi:hypothetical protein
MGPSYCGFLKQVRTMASLVQVNDDHGSRHRTRPADHEADHDAYLAQVGIRRLRQLERDYSAVSLGRHAPEGWPDGKL